MDIRVTVDVFELKLTFVSFDYIQVSKSITTGNINIIVVLESVQIQHSIDRRATQVILGLAARSKIN